VKTFNTITELLETLYRERKLISEMFSKRKSFHFKLRYALSIVEDNEDRINALTEREVLRQNGDFLEIDDEYLRFFEEILDVNEEINLSYINENITHIRENINYYFNETTESRRYAYLRIIKKIFRKIGVVTIKSVIDIRRNIENTFKNEANYKNKQLKLENLDEKRGTVKELIAQTLHLINTEELAFFNTATDEELNRILKELKLDLYYCSHNLVEIETQIINYLNRIKYHGAFLEKLRMLKYLKDQFRIEAETDIRQQLSQSNMVQFEKRLAEPLKLSIDYLREDERAFAGILKIAKRHADRVHAPVRIAEEISGEYLENSLAEEIIINTEEVRNRFVATGDNLFNFILNYDFGKEVSFNERVTLFCQMASQFENELHVDEACQSHRGVEYCLIYSR
jgi:hypothetical protein